MIGLISAVIGLLTAVIPNLVKYLENEQRYKYEIELTRLRMEAESKGLNYQSVITSIKAAVEEGYSLRSHDSVISTNEYINALRASVRPVLTYFFFFVFVGVKVAAISLMFREGIEPLTVIEVVWDVYTVSIFGAIIGFWFGTRSMIYVSESFRAGPASQVIKEITNR